MQISHTDCARPGQEVRARGARWRVIDVRMYASCAVVTLTSASAERIHCRLIDPFDKIEPLDRPREARVVAAAAWRAACRNVVAADTPPGSLREARSARIDLMPHQLEPAMAVCAGAGTRLLLADDVGLGKTIQAGLVVSELRARGWIDRVLVLTPAGLRDQWREELAERFAIEATTMDGRVLRRIGSTLPVGVNPWSTLSVAIASTDYIKRTEVLPAITGCRWDIVVVDEAHASAGDSDRRAAVDALASRASYVMLLTATPHSGDQRAFASLCSVGSVPGDALLVFRRSKADVRVGAKRRLHTIRTQPNEAERRMHGALTRYADTIRAEHASAWLAISVLHKRAFSGAWALHQTVVRRLAALDETTSADAAEQIGLPLDDPEGEFTDADAPPQWPHDLCLNDVARERHLLTAVARAARIAAADESKVAALRRLLRRARESAIVFTEYRDTLLHLRRALHGFPTLVLHGGMTRDERERALATFSLKAGTILLATDAAGEGLNLHRTCRTVINLELPWNPMRLEQRAGRVDRIGQTRTVHAFHLVADQTGETRILDRLKARVATARADISAPDPLGVFDERVMARWVIAGESVDGHSSSTPSTTTDVTVPLVTPGYQAAAHVEATRLRDVRAIWRDGDAARSSGLESDGPWIIKARRRRLRVALGSTALLVWRIAWHDAAGTAIESCLVPVVVHGIPRQGDRARMKRIVAELATWVAPTIEAGSRRWLELAERSIRNLVAARLARERALLIATRTADRDQFQPGLFDRRAERSRLLQEMAAEESDRQIGERIRHVEYQADIHRPAPTLLLAILP